MSKIFGDRDEEDMQTLAESAPPHASAQSQQIHSETDGLPKVREMRELSRVRYTRHSNEEVDVAVLLDAQEAEHPEELDWKKSIVDLMKLLGMDSSYDARKELALEMGYSEELIIRRGSAEMNMWLHKQVLNEVARNGGKLPDDLIA